MPSAQGTAARHPPHRLWRLGFAGLLLGILVLALLPAGSQPSLFHHADKLAHAAAFATLWVVGRLAALPRWPLAGALLAFGLGIEAAQGFFTTTRQASGADVLADAAGMLIGALIHSRLPNKHRRAALE